ncbi:hypothetical protein R3P38DRAFT_3605320 [Favolaschia claudopus]|uniref:F-box domain-containing protein n=1 Tax=Favolaschia claudopus TaxID=2862362 RepID=A0AAW0A8Y0_9AGAR
MLSRESTSTVAQLASEIRTLQSSEFDILSRVIQEVADPCDPITRLPLEISSEIFTHCVPHPNERRGTLSEPLLLLGVCTRWKDIALSIGKLWSNVHIHIPSQLSREYATFLEEWLARAGTNLLYLSFSGPSYPASEILRLVAGHADHLHELVVPSLVYLESGIFSPDSVVPLLEVLRVENSHHRPLEPMHFLESSRVTVILQSAPQLRRLDLKQKYIAGPPVTPPVLHECLTSLVLTDSMAFHLTSFSILESVALPSLMHLEVTSKSAHHIDALLSFLARSSPSLHSFVLDAEKDAWNLESLEGILGLLPHLHSLRLLGDPRIQDQFLRILGQDHSVLPELTAFSFVRPKIWTMAQWYPRLGRVLSARASTLRSFSLEFVNTDGQVQFCDPTEAMSVGSWRVLRELIEGGMQINIGCQAPSDKNSDQPSESGADAEHV